MSGLGGLRAWLTKLLKRRRRFRDGSQIGLADGQLWTFPAPPNGSEIEGGPFATEYEPLVQAVSEAQSGPERGLAELALAIFLLDHNYCLSTIDYQRLLGFEPGFPDSAEWQRAIHRVAQEHIHSLEAPSVVLVATSQSALPAPPAGLGRLVVWARNHLPSRWWSFDS